MKTNQAAAVSIATDSQHRNNITFDASNHFCIRSFKDKESPRKTGLHTRDMINLPHKDEIIIPKRSFLLQSGQMTSCNQGKQKFHLSNF
jgi:hypothetical protein